MIAVEATGKHRCVRLRVHAPLLIGLAAACTPSPSSLAWTIDFEPDAPRPPEVTAVRAWIRAGGCESGATIYDVVLTPSGEMVAVPPVLEDGTFGFGADALDAECRVVARACEEVVVPSASQVTLLLDTLEPPGEGCAAPSVCAAGRCVGGIDAGPTDGGANDAGDRIDAGPPCSSTETDCGDGGDDDCDAMIDCADPDCAEQTCAGGARCGGGVCCSTCVSAGACVASTSPAACGSGGEACVRCPDCVDCRSGVCSGDVTAGTACRSGVCIGSPATTCCTGCVDGDDVTGTCLPGSSDSACGDGGDPCASCGANATCSSRNECCGGCTLTSGACWPGTSRLNCGTGGAECVNCGTGFDCCPAPSGVGGMCVSGGCP